MMNGSSEMEAWMWRWLGQGMDFFKPRFMVVYSWVKSINKLLTKQLEPHWEGPTEHAKKLKFHPAAKGKALGNFK